MRVAVNRLNPIGVALEFECEAAKMPNKCHASLQHNEGLCYYHLLLVQPLLKYETDVLD